MDELAIAMLLLGRTYQSNGSITSVYELYITQEQMEAMNYISLDKKEWLEQIPEEVSGGD